MPSTTFKAHSTEPFEFTVDAGNLDNLDNVNTVELYAWRPGDTHNHVDGVSLSITDSTAKTVEFDPEGAAHADDDCDDAFCSDGVYLGYLKLIHADADDTRHPDEGYITFDAEEIKD